MFPDCPMNFRMKSRVFFAKSGVRKTCLSSNFINEHQVVDACQTRNAPGNLRGNRIALLLFDTNIMLPDHLAQIICLVRVALQVKAICAQCLVNFLQSETPVFLK